MGTTYLIAAAGTGGHVFPGLSVGEALVELGVDSNGILFVGGDRLESKVYPAHGFHFLQVELAGLRRSLSLENLRLPFVVMRARRAIFEAITHSNVRVVLGMGGYVTLPAGLAARSCDVPFFNAEQNAEAGLANRVTSRWARTSFVSFPATGGLEDGLWVGNPVREMFWRFDRSSLRPEATQRYDLDGGTPTLGVFGGSLGASAINEAVAGMLESWRGTPMQVVHLTGEPHLKAMLTRSAAPEVRWLRIGFEERMDLFYAASDLVLARAGGAVAELTATGTPSVLVPGRFGSAGHQTENARFLQSSGAAMVVGQERLDELGATVGGILTDSQRLSAMAAAAHAIAKPDAALTIARAMIEAAH